MIYRQDCLIGMRELADNSVGTVITSPPYNLDIKYGEYKDDKPRDAYLAWMGEVFGEIKRVLRKDGHFFLNLGYSNADPWIAMDVANVARDYFVLQNHINWVKSVFVNGHTHGNFKPINSQRFATPTWESLFHFTHDGKQSVDRLAVGVPYEYKENAVDKYTRWRGRKVKSMGYANWRDFETRASTSEKRVLETLLAEKEYAGEFKRPDLRCRGNAWFIPYAPIRDRDIQRGSHPATYPIELAAKCLKFGGCLTPVLDPFLGTGTTGVACEQLGLPWFGYEIDEKYALFAQERVDAVKNS